MSDERAVSPEQAMTQTERQQHPILTGAGEFAGGMTTPGNMLTQGMMAGAPSAITRTAGAVFSAGLFKNAYDQWPDFKKAIDAKNWPEAERLGTHLVLGTSMAILGAKGAVTGETPYESLSANGREFARAKRLSQTKDGIEQNGVGLYKRAQQSVQTLQAVLQADGAKTIQDAINADEASQTIKGRGSISTSAAVGEAAKLIAKTDANLKPAERAAYSDLMNKPELTLEEAKQLRTRIGRLAFGRNTLPENRAVMTAAYEEIGNGMKDRITELQGSFKPYEHYNNQFKAAFELNKGVGGDMMESLQGQDANASKAKLEKFSDGNIKEITQQMRTLGMNDEAKAFERSHADATALTNAQDAVTGKFQGSIWKLFMRTPKEAWPGLVAMFALHGVLPFPAPQIAGAITGSSAVTGAAKALGGKVGMRLQSDLPPEMFQTRTPAMEPKAYAYKNPDEGWGGEPPAPADPQAAKVSALKQARARKRGSRL
jgi:hypothetical protein